MATKRASRTRRSCWSGAAEWPCTNMAMYYRHRLPVRIMHWINVVAFVVMLMSGLMIFNAHPTLNWGKQSYGDTVEVLSVEAYRTKGGDLRGMTTIFGRLVRYHRLVRRRAECAGHRLNRGVPALVDDPQYVLVGGGAALAFLLHVGVHRERARVRGVVDCQRSPFARSCADARRSRFDLAIDQGSRALQACARRRREALQRVAEADVSERDLRVVAARDPDGICDVAVAECVVARLGRSCSAGGSRRARCISSRRSRSSHSPRCTCFW